MHSSHLPLSFTSNNNKEIDEPRFRFDEATGARPRQLSSAHFFLAFIKIPDSSQTCPESSPLRELQTPRLCRQCISSTAVETETKRSFNRVARRRSCSHGYRSASFKEDEGTWKGNDDGKVVNNQPQRVMDDRNGIGPQSGYIAKITNDARETEMEENMGQVNTMIGNLRNMAIDMGSELENQNRQIDRINRKVSAPTRLLPRVCDAAPSPGVDLA